LKNHKVGSIKTGGLMFYGSNCLVLFYRNFSTSYRYAKLGAIEGVSGLTAAPSGGNVQVTFTPMNRLNFHRISGLRLPHLLPESTASLG
jgi:hypothetical protein